MKQTRSNRAKLNIIVSLLGQLVALVCGFIGPRLLLKAFGSEAYGATASITQFLAYITLLEGGIGGVARAVLYKPLANDDKETISAVVAELQHFLNVIAYLFLGYVLVLACTFTKIAEVEVFDWWTTFLLVLSISISTFAQYFIGLRNSVLLQAAQKTYITISTTIVTTILNTVFTVVLIKLGCGLPTVKLVSSCIFVLRPVVLHIYVKRSFGLPRCKTRNKDLLSQKWTGLGQHIAYFLHSNTDVVVLTVFADLSSVAVYAVYHMITSHLQNLISSFCAGMEALFGDMIAKDEIKELNQSFNKYETLISLVSVIFMASAVVLLVPFIELYTAGVEDADYRRFGFGVLLILSSLLYCLRMPYHSVVLAAGHFKQTKLAAYGEALINIVSSIILVKLFGLVGVAIGTLAATGFRFVFYVIYLSKNIIKRSAWLFVKRICVNSGCILAAVLLNMQVSKLFQMGDYIRWAVAAVAVAAVAAVVTVAITALFYPKDLRDVVQIVLKKKKRSK